jgi:type II secretory pathway pseudopilin PulG
MFSVLIVSAFVALIAGPAILSSIQKARSRQQDLN